MGGEAMEHRILCIEVEDGEIVAVGTGGEDGVAHRRWVVAEVRRAIEEGERFFIASFSAGAEAEVDVLEDRLRMESGAPEDSLAQLRSCRWR
jgi:hypothetical protein